MHAADRVERYGHSGETSAVATCSVGSRDLCQPRMRADRKPVTEATRVFARACKYPPMVGNPVVNVTAWCPSMLASACDGRLGWVTSPTMQLRLSSPLGLVALRPS